jgi:hypothetical protein
MEDRGERADRRKRLESGGVERGGMRLSRQR